MNKKSTSSSLLRFARNLSGQYSNRQQSQDHPRLFAHINIYFIPLEKSICKGPFLYSEQSFDHCPWSPYRQGIHKLIEKNGIIILENYHLENPERVAGAGFTPKLLTYLRNSKIEHREGCNMHFQEIAKGEYQGQVEGSKCIIKRDNKSTYLRSRVFFNNKIWKSMDEGFDLITKEKVWGSNNGLLEFNKIIDYGDNINREWMK